GSLAVAYPYRAFLGVRFGTLIPESGAAVRFLSLCYGTLFVLGPRGAFYFPPESVPAIYYLGRLRKAVQVLLGEPLLFPVSITLSVSVTTATFKPRPF